MPDGLDGGGAERASPTMARASRQLPRRRACGDPRQHPGRAPATGSSRASRAFLEAQVASRSLTPQPGIGARRGAVADGGQAAAATTSRARSPNRPQLPSEAAGGDGRAGSTRRGCASGADAGAGGARRRASGRRTEGSRAMLWSILKILLFLAVVRGARLRRRLDPRDPGRGADRLRQPRVLRLADRLRARPAGAGAAGARAS